MTFTRWGTPDKSNLTRWGTPDKSNLTRWGTPDKSNLAYYIRQWNDNDIDYTRNSSINEHGGLISCGYYVKRASIPCPPIERRKNKKRGVPQTHGNTPKIDCSDLTRYNSIKIFLGRSWARENGKSKGVGL